MYFLDGQTVFTDDAVQTRLLMLMANERYQGEEEELAKLPLVYKYATEVFESHQDFSSFVDQAMRESRIIKKEFPLKRASQRVIKNYALLCALAKRL